MKILIVAQTFAPQQEGGAEVVARRAAEHLSRTHEVRVLSMRSAELTPNSEPDLSYVDRLAFRGTYLPGVGKKVDVPKVKKLIWHVQNAIGGVYANDIASYLDQVRPDVIYAHNATAFQPQLGRLAKERRIPVVQHLHDYAYACPRASMFRNGHNCETPCLSCRILTRQWRSSAAASTTDVIAVSAFVRDRLNQFGVMPKARWHVMHNIEDPVQLAAFRPAPRDRDAPFVFGFLGALTAEKGIPDLLDAFLTLPKNRVRLLVGGRGEDALVSELKSKSAGFDVAWLDHVDPNELLVKCDALVVPSLWHEPQALVVTEGVARNLTVIGSNRGGTTEILDNYERGILYNPDTQHALAVAMKRSMEMLPASSEIVDVQHSGFKAEADYYERLELILNQFGTQP